MSTASSPQPQPAPAELNPRRIVGMLRDYGLALRQTAEALGGDLEAKARTIRDGEGTLAERREAVAMLRAYARSLAKAGRSEEAAGVIAQADALERDRQGELVRRFAGEGAAGEHDPAGDS